MTSKIQYRCINKDQIEALDKVVNYKNKYALSNLVNTIQTETPFGTSVSFYRVSDFGCSKLYINLDEKTNEIVVQKWFNYQTSKYIYGEYYKINPDGNVEMVDKRY